MDSYYLNLSRTVIHKAVDELHNAEHYMACAGMKSYNCQSKRISRIISSLNNCQQQLGSDLKRILDK